MGFARRKRSGQWKRLGHEQVFCHLAMCAGKGIVKKERHQASGRVDGHTAGNMTHKMQVGREREQRSQVGRKEREAGEWECTCCVVHGGNMYMELSLAYDQDPREALRGITTGRCTR